MRNIYPIIQKAPSRLPWRGKRSAVAVVNDSPVDCQSRDRATRRWLSAKLTEGWKVEYLEMSETSGIIYTFGSHPSDPATPGHLKVNCPKGKRDHPGVPLRGEAWGSSTV